MLINSISHFLMVEVVLRLLHRLLGYDDFPRAEASNSGRAMIQKP
jgi:hypothetical protein